MNLVDSSAWLEYFADGPNAQDFSKPIETVSKLIVPTMCIYEVFKRVLVQRGEDSALQAVALMRQGRIIDLDFSLSLLAAKISVESKLPGADSIILATAQSFEAVLWTQDRDFEGIAGVRYFAKC
jgi:predicted nucleic acid-binding protein